MYFNSVEEIANRIEFIAEEQEYADYRKCIMKASPDFEEILEAWDIISLTALELYQKSVEGMCCKVRHYKYSIGENEVVYYRVTKQKEVAFFEVEEIMIRVEE